MADSEDEDILYDNQLGRTLIGGKHVKNVDDVLKSGNKDRRKLRKTLALCLAFLCLGLCVAVLGPTLLSLKEYFETILPKTSLVFTGRSVGYLFGALVGGMLIEYLNPMMLIGTTLFLCGVGFIVAPYLGSLLLFGIAMSTVGVSMGILDTGANLVCLRMWGAKHSSTMLQALHFSFAFGAFLSPLLAAPFLAEQPSNSSVAVQAVPDSYNPSHLLLTTPGLVNVSTDGHDGSLHQNSTSNNTVVTSESANLTAFNTSNNTNVTSESANTRTNDTSSGTKTGRKRSADSAPKSTVMSINVSVTASTSNKSGPQKHIERFLIAYLIIGIFVLASSLIFFYFFITKPRDEPSLAGDDDSENGVESKKCTFRIRILCLLFVFYFFYVGAEVTYGGFVAAFAVESTLGFDQDHAAHIVSLFWGTFTFGRGLAICLASVISPLKMVLADLVGCIVASTALSIYAEKVELVFWVGTALIGFSMASLFPSGIAWLQSYTEVTGNAASLLVVGSSLGEMLVPLALSLLFKSEWGPMSLMYFMLVISVSSALIFFYVMWLAAEKGEQRKSLPAEKSPAVDLLEGIKEALPLEDISIQNGHKNGKQMTKQLIPPKLKKKDHRE